MAKENQNTAEPTLAKPAVAEAAPAAPEKPLTGIDKIAAKQKEILDGMNGTPKAEEKAADAPVVDKEDEEVIVDVAPQTVKKEEKAAEKKAPKKFWADKEILSPEKATETPAPAATFEIPKEISEKASAYDMLINNPAIKAVLKAEESGKSFFETINEITSKDPNKLAPLDVYKIKLDRMKGMNDEKRAEMLDSFRNKEEIDQYELTADYREKLAEAWDKELKDYIPDPVKSVQAQKEAQKAEQAKWQKTDMGLREIAKASENKEVLGITYTPQMRSEVENYMAKNQIIKILPDGSFDPQDLHDTIFAKLYLNKILDNVFEMGQTVGFEKLEEEVILPAKTDTALSSSQPRKGAATPAENMQALRQSYK